VLRDPNSFTRLDFNELQTRYDAVLSRLRDAIQFDPKESSSPTRLIRGQPQPPHQHSEPQQHNPGPSRQQIRYWNEYDDGSEHDDNNDEYVIYIRPEDDDDDDDDWTLPGLAYLTNIITLPYRRARAWFARTAEQREQKGYNYDTETDTDTDIERRPLFLARAGSATDTDDFSGDDVSGHFSVQYGTIRGARQQQQQQQQQQRHRRHSRILAWTARGTFSTTLVLLAIEVFLLGTGRPRTDIAVAVAAVAGLFLAGAGLWAVTGTWLRDGADDVFPERRPSPEAKLMGWVVFLTTLVLNVLVLCVVGGRLGGMHWW